MQSSLRWNDVGRPSYRHTIRTTFLCALRGLCRGLDGSLYRAFNISLLLRSTMKTGGHIKPCKVGQVEQHNRRDPAYVERMASSKHPLHFYPHLACRANVDIYESKYSEQFNCVMDIFNAMIARYQEMDKRHRKPPLKDRERIDKKTGKKIVVSGWSPIREMVVVIKSDTTVEQMKKFSAWLKAKKGIETIFTSLHFDEGHIGKKDGKFHCNFHAHVGLDFFNWETGKTIKLDKNDMSDIQTALAECLGMERGEIKEITEAEHLDVVEYRLKAEEEAIRQEHQERIEKSALEVEKMEAKKAALDKQVGFGARVGAIFKVGELHEAHKEAEKAVEEERKKWEAEKEKIIRDAKKAVSAAEKKADEQLSTERRTIEQRAFLVAKKTILSTAGLMEMQGKVPTLREIGDYFGKKCKEVAELGRKVLQLQEQVERLTARIEVEKENELIWALGLMPGADRRNIPKEKTAENIQAFFLQGIKNVLGRVGNWLERQGLSIEQIDAEERRREWQEKFQKNEDIKEDLAEENRRGHRRF